MQMLMAQVYIPGDGGYFIQYEWPEGSEQCNGTARGGGDRQPYRLAESVAKRHVSAFFGLRAADVRAVATEFAPGWFDVECRPVGC